MCKGSSEKKDDDAYSCNETSLVKPKLYFPMQNEAPEDF